eukprot:10774931-Prorocentrum_lima.AAC.1
MIFENVFLAPSTLTHPLSSQDLLKASVAPWRRSSGVALRCESPENLNFRRPMNADDSGPFCVENLEGNRNFWTWR